MYVKKTQNEAKRNEKLKLKLTYSKFLNNYVDCFAQIKENVIVMEYKKI